MRNFKSRNTVIALAIFGISALLQGCGSGPAPSVPAPPAGVVPPGTNPNNLPAGCLLMNQSWGFSAPQGYMDNVVLNAGSIPMDSPKFAGQTFGTVSISAGGATGAYQSVNNPVGATDGTISLNFTPTAGSSNYNGIGGTAGGVSGQVTGTITMSSTKQQFVLTELQTQYSTVNTMTTFPSQLGFQTASASLINSVCIVNVAIQLSRSNFTLYDGSVYAYFYLPYMNTTMIGTAGSAPSLSTFTGAALYSLPKIRLRF